MLVKSDIGWIGEEMKDAGVMPGNDGYHTKTTRVLPYQN
jgi:hypothetical protein